MGITITIMGINMKTWTIAAAAVALTATTAYADPYVSGGVGALRSLQTSNTDEVEFSTDPWFHLNAAVGDDAIVTEGPMTLGVEVEGDVIPLMPLHGRNDGRGDANHHTADGQNFTMGSLMVNAEPQIEVGKGVKAYVVGGAGVGIREDGAGIAYQGGVGVKVPLTEALSADGSVRYRNIDGLGFIGPEVRLAWKL